MKIKIFLVCVFFQLIWISANAQKTDDRFVGDWALESIEFRESLYDGSGKETKVIYTLKNLNDLPHFYNVITEMSFPELDEELEMVDRLEKVDNNESYITTTAGRYENPLVKFFDSYIQFARQENTEELENNQYGFVFKSSEKLVLISREVFYPKNGDPMKALLHITLSRKSK